jgi:ClpP class serine protease
MSLIPWRKTRLAVIELHGTISTRPGALNLSGIEPAIRRGFAAADGRPVILDIESPGGSPVQSDLIAHLIRRLADRDGVRVHAVIREVGASGGYWLACAADEIHANPMSIVGSIGVRGGGFGFPALLSRLGIEHRLYTAGENKARFDPFAPEKPQDVAFAKQLMDDLHERFKDWVRSRRAHRLRGPEETLFDGGFMLGQAALERGLIDGLNDVDGLVRQLAGDRVRVRRFGRKRRSLLARIPRLAADGLLEALESRTGGPSLHL